MKPAVVREVRSLHMQCDRVGNLLLAKFACKAARDCVVLFPGAVVFRLLELVPPTTHTLTAPPSGMPAITRNDWRPDTPRVLGVRLKLSNEGMRMIMKLDARTDLTLLLSPHNIELMRQMMLAYRTDLLDVGD